MDNERKNRIKLLSCIKLPVCTEVDIKHVMSHSDDEKIIASLIRYEREADGYIYVKGWSYYKRRVGSYNLKPFILGNFQVMNSHIEPWHIEAAKRLL